MRGREGKESNEKESLRKSGAAFNYKFVAKYYDDGDEINNKNSHRFHNYNRNAKREQSVAIFANQHQHPPPQTITKARNMT